MNKLAGFPASARRERLWSRSSALLTTAVFVLMGGGAAHALPGDGTVVAGQADINITAPGQMIITQGSDKAIINWRDFSIGASESVIFAQPSAESLAINRVLGNDPSYIFGSLTANGKVMLINPNGILFGATSRVDVNSLIATTLDAPDERLLNNDFRFDIQGNPAASVVNRGVITAAEGGLVALVAPGVANDGIIQARLGNVTLAGADEFSVDLYGDGLVSLPASTRTVDEIYDAEGNALSAPVSNNGEIRAAGGTVVMAARTAKHMVDDVVNMGGVIEARAVGVRNGVIVLDGGSGGTVRTAGKMDVSGTGAGEKGGKVTVTGKKVVLAEGTDIDARGDAGGGTVLAGGDYQGGGDTARATETVMEDGARIDVSATNDGDGGKAILWADERTTFGGTILARGSAAGGDGGLVETSGRELLAVRDTGRVDASAAYGLAGLWLLDPRNVYLRIGTGDSVPGGGLYNPSVDDAVVNINTIQTALAGGTSVTITTHDVAGLQAGNIIFEGSINAATTGGATFSLQADNNILMGGYALTSSGLMNISMQAGGQIQMGGGSMNSANGSISLKALDMDLNGTINAGTGVVTLLGNDGQTIALGSGAGSLSLSSAELAGITAGTLRIGNALSGAMTIGADITPGASIVHLRSGAGITGTAGGVIATQLALEAGGAITMTDASTSVSKLAVSAAGQTVQFKNLGAFEIATVDGVVGAKAATLKLDAGGALTQTSAIVAPTLEVTSTGDVTLANAGNDASSLKVSAAGKAVSYTDVNALDLAGVTAGSLTVSAGGAVTDSAATVTGILDVTATGAVTLDVATNDVTTLRVSAGANTVTYRDVSGFDIAKMVVGSAILTAGGAVTQSAAFSLTTLDITSTGDVTLTNAANNIATLKVSAAGKAVSYTDANALDLGGVTAGSLTVSAGGAVTDSAATVVTTLDVTATGAVTLDHASNDVTSLLISAGANAVTYRDASGFDIAKLVAGATTLNAGGALTQSTAISLTSLDITSTGNVTLTKVGNDITSLKVAAAGKTVAYTDATGLDLAGVTASGFTLVAGGAVTDSAATVAATIDVTATGAVTMDHASNDATTLSIDAGGNAVTYRDVSGFDIAKLVGGAATLTVGGALTQSTALTLTSLDITSTGNVTLTKVGNDVGSLKVSAAGKTVAYTDANAVSLAGITASGLTLIAGGAVTDSAATVVTTLGVTAGGSVVLDHAGNDADVIAMDAGVNDITFVDADGVDIGTAGALNGIKAANFTLQAGGAVTDSQASAITGLTTVQAGANAVTLDHASNNFNELAVTASALTVRETDALVLKATTVTGALDVRAKAGLTVAANVSAAGGATLDADFDDNGVGDFTVNGGATVSSSGAIIDVTANDVIITGALNSGAGVTTLRVSDGGSIDIGSGGSGGMNLSAAEVAAVTAGVLKIGDATAGAIVVSSTVTPGAGALHLHTGSTITGTAGGIVVGGLALQAGGAVDVTNAANNFTTLAVSAAGQTVKVAELNGFAVGTVNLIAGATAGTMEITTGGALTDSAATVATNLKVTASGAVTLDTATNNVSVLEVNAGANNVTYVDTNGFDVAGITGNNVVLQGGGAITDSGAITATGLGVQSTGAVTFDHAGSNVATLAANTAAQNFSYIDADGFDIGTVGTVVGIQAGTVTLNAGGAVTDSNSTVATTLNLTAAGAVTMDHAANNLTNLKVSAAGQNVTFNELNAIDLQDITAKKFVLAAGGAVTDTGRILVDELGIGATGAVTLNTANNNAGKIAISAGANAVTFVDEDALEIAAVGAYTGITGGAINLTAGGGVTGTSAVSGTSLALKAGGNVAMDGVANALTDLAIDAGAFNVAYRDTNALNITTLSGVVGIKAAALDLTVGGNLTDAAALIISGHTGIVSSAGTIALDMATNDFNTLSVSHVGNITAINDANALEITGITRTSGTGTATLSSAAGMTVSGNISTGAVTLNADSNNDGAGTFTLNGGVSISTLSNAAIIIGSGDIVLDGTTNSGTGNTAVYATGGNTIDLGSGGGGAYNISQAEINQITAQGIRVGDALSGALTVSSNISAANATELRLQGAGITATAGAIIENSLAIVSTGAVTMTNTSNLVTNLAVSAAGQTVSYYNAGALNINTVYSITGASAGTLRLETNGAVTDSQASTGTNLAVISTGAITLDHASNNFTNVAFYAPGKAVTYRDANAVAINTVSGVTGVEAASLTLTTTNGAVTDGARSLISGATTLNTGTGAITLDHASNDFNTLTITAGGATTVVDANALTLKNVTTSGAATLQAVSGLTVDGNISTGGALTLNGDSNADNAGTLTINTARTVATTGNQNITLTGADLDIQGTGSVNSGTGTTIMRAAGATRAVDIAGVGAVYNVSQAEINAVTAGTLQIESGSGASSLTLSNNITAPGTNTLFLKSGSGGINTTAGSINIANLALQATGAGNINARNAGNDVDNIAIQIATGTADFLDLDGVNIGAVAGITGLNSTMTAGAGRTIHIEAAGITDSAVSTVQNFGFTSTGAVTLDEAGNNFAVIAGAASGQDVSITDSSGIEIGSVTTLVPSTLNGITAQNFTLNTGGAITDTQKTVIGNNTTINAGTAAVTLDHAANDFSKILVTAGVTKLVDVNDINVGASSIDGTLDISANGNLTVSGNVTSTGDATFRADMDNSGAGTFAVNGGSAVSTGGADLFITAADFNLAGNLNSGAGDTKVAVDAGRSIGVGDTAADMTIDKAELLRITAENLYIGGNQTGDITGDNVAATDLANIMDSLYLLALGNGADIHFINNASSFKNVYGEADDSIFVDKDLTATVAQISLRADMDAAADPDGDQIYVTDGIKITSVGSSLFESTNGITISRNIDIFGDLVINADTDGDGTGTLTLQGGYSISTNNYNLSLIAADFVINGLINAGTGKIQVEATNGRSIGVGDAAGDAQISKAELQRLSAGTLYIGGTNTGNIVVDNVQVADVAGIDGTITMAALASGANVTFNNVGSSFGKGLSLLADQGVSLDRSVTTGGAVAVDADYDDDGVGDFSISATRTLDSTDHDIDVVANDVNIAGAIDSGTAKTIFAASDNAAIGLGGAGGGFNLSTAELNNITSSLLKIGTAAGGPITVSGDIAPVNSDTLVLYSGGAITATAGGIAVDTLGLYAGGAINVTDTDTNIGTLAAQTTVGGITVHTAGALGAGTVDGLTGVSTAGGDILLRAHDFDLATAVNAGAGKVTLQGQNGDTIGLGGAGGDVNLTAAELAKVTADTLHIGTAAAGAITISADSAFSTVNTLKLQTGAGVTGTAGGVTVTNLDIAAGGDVEITDTSTDVTTLAVNAAGHKVKFFDASALSAAITADSADIAANNGLTMTGSLAGNGTVSLNADADNDGSGTLTLNAAVAVSTNNNALTIKANDIVLQAGATLSAGTQTAEILVTNGGAINLGGAGSNMNLSNAELAAITANTLTIGDATAGAITLHSVLTHNATTMNLRSGGAITGTAGAVAVNTLNLMAGDTINMSNAGNDVDNLSVTATGKTVTFTDADGINLAGVDAGSLSLTTGGAVTDSAATKVGALTVAASGAVTMDHAANDADTINIAAGANPITYVDVDGFDIAGLTGGAVALTAGGAVTDSGAITATTLDVTATDNVTLDTAANDVDNLKVVATGKAVTFTDADGINLAGIDAGSLSLTAGGAVTDSVATKVGTLSVTASGPVTMDVAANDADTVTIAAGGNAVTYVDADGFDIAGLTGGAVTLTAGGAVTDSGTITATTLDVTATDDVTLNSVANDVDNLKILATGKAVTFVDADGINLAGIDAGSLSLTAGGAVTDSVATKVGALTVTTSGAVTMDHAANDADTINIAAGANPITYVDADGFDIAGLTGGVVTLTAGGAVADSGTVAATTLDITATDDVTLNSAANDVDNLKVAAAGKVVTFVDADGVNLAGMNANSLSLTTGGAVTDNAATTVTTLNVTAGGDVILDFATNDVASLNIDAGANNVTYVDASGFDVAGIKGATVALTAGGALTDSGAIIANNLNVTGAGAVTLDAPGLDVNNLAVSAAGQTVQITHADNINLAGVTAGAFTLNAGAAVTDSAATVVTTLTLVAGDDVTMDFAGNDAATININAGAHDIIYRDATGFDVAGLTGDVVTLTAGGAVTDSGTIAAATLDVTATDDVTLNSAANDVDNLKVAAAGKAVTFTDVDGINLSGVTAGSLSLTAGGAVTDSAATIANNLSVTAGDDVTLDEGTNDVAVLTISAVGKNVTYRDANGLDVAGISAKTIALTAGGALTDSGAITAESLTLTAGDNAVLDFAGNDVDSLVVSAAGKNVTFVDSDAIDLAGINAGSLSLTAGGAVTDSAATKVGTLSVTASGPVTMNEAANDADTVNIAAGANAITYVDTDGFDIAGLTGGAVTLTAGGAVTDSGAITATTLDVTATDDVTLNSAANDVDNLKVAATGKAVTFVDADGINLAGVEAGSLSLTAGGAVTDSVATKVGTLAVTASGPVTMDVAANDADTVTIAAGGNAVTYVDADGFDIAGLTGGVVTLTAGGAMTDSGTITATTLDVTATDDVTLNTAVNDVDNLKVLSTGKAVTFTDADGINLAGIDAGSLSLTAGGAVTDSVATKVGTLAVTASGPVTMDHAANDADTINIAAGGNAVTYVDVDGIDLAGITAGSLTLTAGGAVTDSAATKVGTLIVTASGGVAMDHAANDADTINIAAGANPITYVDADGFDIAGLTGGAVALTAGGAVTDSGAITATTLDMTATDNITLDTAANDVDNLKVIATGKAVTFTDADGINLAGIDAGSLSLTAGGAVTDSVATKVGTLSVTASGPVTMDVAANDADIVTIAAGGNTVTYVDADGFDIAGLTGGVVTLTAGGAVTDSGTITATTLDVTATDNVTLNSAANDVDNLKVLATGKAVTFTDADGINLVGLEAGSLTLTTGGAVTDSVATKVGTLAVTAGGAVTMDHAANDADTINIAAGANPITYVDADGFDIAGLTGGAVTLTAGGAVTDSGTIAATTLDVTATDDVTLNSAANDVDNLKVVATGKAVTFTDADGINLAGIDAASLSLTAGGAVTDSVATKVGTLSVTASGPVTMDAAANDADIVTIVAGGNAVTYVDTDGFDIAGLTGGVVTLTAGGAVTDSGTIAATTLDVTATDDVTLNTAANDVDNLKVLATGKAVTFTDADGINLAGIEAGSLSLTAGGAVTDSAATKVAGATTLNAGAANDITLDHAANDFGTVDVTAARDVILVDVNALTVGDVTAKTLDAAAANGLTANGTVATTGAMVLNADADNNGTGVFQLGAAGDLSATNAEVTIRAADVNLLGTISSGSAATNILATNGRSISLGGAGGDIAISNAELDAITAAVLRIGDATAGNITVVADIAPANAGALHLRTGGGVTATAGGITTNALALDAGTGIAVTDTTTAVSTLAARTTAGSVNFVNDGALTIGTVDGLSGIQATAGNVTLRADDFTIAQTINNAGGITTLLGATGGTISLGGAGGDMALSNAELNAITAATLRIGEAAAGDVTVVADIAPASVGTLHLRTGGAVTGTAGGITANNLALSAGTGINVTDTSTTVSNLAATTAAGTIDFANSGALAVTTVDGISGLQTAGGDITLRAADMNVLQAINSGAGITTLLGAAGGTISLGGAGGALALSDTELDQVTAAILRIGEAAAGAITVAGDISPAGASILHLRTGGGITGTAGGIAVGNLALSAAGTVNITDADNNVGTLAVAAPGAGVTFHDADALVIGTVDGVAGATAATLNINTGAGLTDTAAIAAGTMSVTAGGAVALDHAANDVDNLAVSAAGQAVTFNDVDGINLAGVTAGSLALSTAGAVTDSVASVISGSTSIAAGAGNDITLDAANDFNTLAISSGRNAVINDVNAVTMGASNLAGTLDMMAASGITLAGVVTAAGTTNMNADSDNNGTGTFTVNGGQALSTGNAALSVTAADINLAGTISSGTGLTTVTASNSGAIGLGTAAAMQISAAEAANITAGTLRIGNQASTAGIVIGDNMNFAGVTNLHLRSAGAVNEAAGSLQVANLAVSAGGPVTLTQATNNVGVIAINAPGQTIGYRDADAFSVGTVDGVSGITGTVIGLQSGGAMNGTEAINGTDLTVTAAGTVNLGTASNNVTNLTVNAAGQDVTFRDGNALNLAGITAQNATITANGTLDDTGALNVAGLLSLAAGAGGNITVDHAGNNLSAMNIVSGNNVTIVDGNSLSIGNSTISGVLDVDVQNNLTIAGAVNVGGNVDVTANPANNGIFTINGGAGLYVPGRGVTVTAYDAAINGALDAGAGGNVTMLSNAGASWGLGSGAGQFNLSSAELARIVAGTMTVGGAGSGDIRVSNVSTSDSAGIGTMILQAYGNQSAVEFGAGSVSFRALQAEADAEIRVLGNLSTTEGNMTLDGDYDNNFDVGYANNIEYGPGVVVYAEGDLTAGGTTGKGVMAGDLTLETGGGDVTIDYLDGAFDLNINAGDGDVTITGAVGGVTPVMDAIIEGDEITGEIHAATLEIGANEVDMTGTVGGLTGEDAAGFIVLYQTVPGPYLMNGFLIEGYIPPPPPPAETAVPGLTGPAASSNPSAMIQPWITEAPVGLEQRGATPGDMMEQDMMRRPFVANIFQMAENLLSYSREFLRSMTIGGANRAMVAQGGGDGITLGFEEEDEENNDQ